MIAGFYGIVDPAFGDPVAQLEILLGEGVATVQLRCKGWDAARLGVLARRARALARALARRAPGGPPVLVINDEPGVARAIGAWVHLGQGDGPDPDVPFGRSTHTLAQLGEIGSAAYVGFGPVFGTATKATGYAPRGLEALAEAARASTVPVVAIGGIDPSNVASVRASGAQAWTSIGAVWGARDPRAVIRAMR